MRPVRVDYRLVIASTTRMPISGCAVDVRLAASVVIGHRVWSFVASVGYGHVLERRTRVEADETQTVRRRRDWLPDAYG